MTFPRGSPWKRKCLSVGGLSDNLDMQRVVSAPLPCLLLCMFVCVREIVDCATYVCLCMLFVCVIACLVFLVHPYSFCRFLILFLSPISSSYFSIFYFLPIILLLNHFHLQIISHGRILTRVFFPYVLLSSSSFSSSSSASSFSVPFPSPSLSIPSALSAVLADVYIYCSFSRFHRPSSAEPP